MSRLYLHGLWLSLPVVLLLTTGHSAAAQCTRDIHLLIDASRSIEVDHRRQAIEYLLNVMGDSFPGPDGLSLTWFAEMPRPATPDSDLSVEGRLRRLATAPPVATLKRQDTDLAGALSYAFDHWQSDPELLTILVSDLDHQPWGSSPALAPDQLAGLPRSFPLIALVTPPDKGRAEIRNRSRGTLTAHLTSSLFVDVASKESKSVYRQEFQNLLRCATNSMPPPNQTPKSSPLKQASAVATPSGIFLRLQIEPTAWPAGQAILTLEHPKDGILQRFAPLRPPALDENQQCIIDLTSNSSIVSIGPDMILQLDDGVSQYRLGVDYHEEDTEPGLAGLSVLRRRLPTLNLGDTLLVVGVVIVSMAWATNRSFQQVAAIFLVAQTFIQLAKARADLILMPFSFWLFATVVVMVGTCPFFFLFCWLNARRFECKYADRRAEPQGPMPFILAICVTCALCLVLWDGTNADEAPQQTSKTPACFAPSASSLEAR